MLINNVETTLRDVLKNYMKKSDEIIICTPFVSSTDLLFELLDSNKKVKLILRLSYPATPDFLSQLLKYQNNRNRIFVYDDTSLHAKIYLFRRNRKNFAAIIGSSNFTNSGVSENKELNVLLKNELGSIEKYIDFIIKNAYSELNNDVIDYYKSFYRKPKIPGKYKKISFDKKIVDEYESILVRYNHIKGILKKLNNTKLPFTYVFDAFCHQFKVNIISGYNLKKLKSFTPDRTKKYFSLFLNEYFDKTKKTKLFVQYNRNTKIRKELSKIDNNLIKDFFLSIHSVNSGSGSGVRKREIKNTPTQLLKNILEFILFENIEMSTKIAISLTPTAKKGKRIRFLGSSSIREIPGWLIPEKYPIINSKFLYILDFLSI